VNRVINRGEVFVDVEYGTLWVNDSDWVQYIANVLGGADNDDACWVHQFEDYDGTQKILFWRSPNQLGEYVLATPAAGSHTIEWETVSGNTSWRKADSRKLPARIDTMTVDYLNLVDVESAGGLGEGHDYSISIMDLVIERQKENGAALGTYCNMLMVVKALWNSLPKQPPAPLEDVIDASVKTGARLGGVMEWCKSAKGKLIAGGFAIPYIIQNRVTKNEPLLATVDHWLDHLYHGIRTHIKNVEARRETLAQNTTPPVAVMDAGKDWQLLGQELRSIYSRYHVADEHGTMQFDIDKARLECEKYLNQYPVNEQEMILLGVLYEAYMGDNNMQRKDGQAWQLGVISATTMNALRNVGVLKHLEQGDNQIFAFNQTRDIEVALPITINGVWFNLIQAKLGAVKMSDIAKDMRESYKRNVGKMTEQGKFSNRTYLVETRGDRKVVLNEDGVLIGYVAKQDTHRLIANAIVVTNVAHDNDGNLRFIVKSA
jgi:hypothetical protein